MVREFIMPHRIITGAGALEAAAPELGRMGKREKRRAEIALR